MFFFQCLSVKSDDLLNTLLFNLFLCSSYFCYCHWYNLFTLLSNTFTINHSIWGILITWPVIFLNTFTNSNNFICILLGGFYVYNYKNFFPDLSAFFFSLIFSELARTSCKLLNRSRDFFIFSWYQRECF